MRAGLKRLAIQFKPFPSEEQVGLWFEKFGSWPAEKFMFAVEKLVDEKPDSFWPIVSDVKRAAENWKPKGTTVVANSELPKRETDEEFRARQKLAKQELERFKAERPDLFVDSEPSVNAVILNLSEKLKWSRQRMKGAA